MGNGIPKSIALRMMAWCILAAAIRPAAGSQASPGAECRTGSRTLFYSSHPLLDGRTAPGFSDSLRQQLRIPLGELGYCLEEVKDYRAILDTVRYGDDLLLQTRVGEDGAGT